MCSSDIPDRFCTSFLRSATDSLKKPLNRLFSTGMLPLSLGMTRWQISHRLHKSDINAFNVFSNALITR